MWVFSRNFIRASHIKMIGDDDIMCRQPTAEHAVVLLCSLPPCSTKSCSFIFLQKYTYKPYTYIYIIQISAQGYIFQLFFLLTIKYNIFLIARNCERAISHDRGQLNTLYTYICVSGFV